MVCARCCALPATVLHSMYAMYTMHTLPPLS
jgi:hypothetical protein